MIVITLLGKSKKKNSRLLTLEKKIPVVQKTEGMPEELNNRLEKIEKLLEGLGKKPVQYNFNIDKLDIHNPVIEELTFSLDKLDVEEVSGALNLGNNFGVSVDKTKKEESKSKSQSKTKTQ